MSVYSSVYSDLSVSILRLNMVHYLGHTKQKAVRACSKYMDSELSCTCAVSSAGVRLFRFLADFRFFCFKICSGELLGFVCKLQKWHFCKG